MSYHLYYTPAFVLGSSPFGEGSARLTLFSRELGMIVASATSVRKECSKLRYGLQDLSLSEITAVRGREAWRITNALLIENIYAAFRKEPQAALMFARIFRLLRRLVVGEEKNERLFATLQGAFQFLKDSPHLANPLSHTETTLVLRILHILGYLAERALFEPFLKEPFLWNELLLRRVAEVRALALSSINTSLKESQL